MSDVTDVKLEKLLASIALQYPEELCSQALNDIERTVFHMELALRAVGANGAVCDLGGSVSLVSVGCAALGMRAILVDKYVTRWPIREKAFDAVHRRYGVEVIERDAVAEPLDLPAGSLDVAASFDSIEHWHGSPKPALRALKAALRPGATLVIATPNGVNLRKRITVPFGYGKWCSTADWYEAPEFLSHVHEPDVDDLRYIARDLGLEDARIFGRNWAGYAHPRRLVRAGTRVADRLLRLRPSLCADLYLTGRV